MKIEKENTELKREIISLETELKELRNNVKAILFMLPKICSSKILIAKIQDFKQQ